MNEAYTNYTKNHTKNHQIRALLKYPSSIKKVFFQSKQIKDLSFN